VIGSPVHPSPTAHLVYLRSGPMVLTRQPFRGWREIQDAFGDYMTSLGPWTEDEIIDFFGEDFGDEARWPFSRARIRDFFAADVVSIMAD
jgi:hypothetical protein